MEKQIIKTDLEATLELAQIPPSNVDEIRDNFAQFLADAEAWERQALAIQVRDENDTAAMSLARELRLRGRAVRLDADKTRKRLKEDALRYGNAVQSVYNLIREIVEPTEKHLLDLEKYAERKEQERREALLREREQALAPFMPLVTPVNLQALGSLPPEVWDFTLARARTEHQERLDAEAEEERRRIEAEAAEREAMARREAELAEARKKAEALEAENRRLREIEAEAARKAAQEREQAQRLAEAPDREKLMALAQTLNQIQIPDLTTERGRETGRQVVALLGKVVKHIKDRHP